MTLSVGIGYDVHRLVPDRPLILGGVEIPFEMGLLGHSDGDVLAHAVIDAVIGALGKGDIGGFFPDTDAAYRGKSGADLCAELLARLEGEEFTLVNLDATIIAQEPKLARYIPAMRENLGRWLGVGPEEINIKAKTHEGIGALGRKEGIAAMAVVLLERKKTL
ncbi:MAG: 2-C-methyl-D-erythritol 2,4-cyclodiphosphate synthase [Deltaproteobacteria bacterium]|nr:MAG: 2-C-methyl-D-erythritol 2,4-cyclodiphosphate synthase [Deltaproteobacteria bacterium]